MNSTFTVGSDCSPEAEPDIDSSLATWATEHPSDVSLVVLEPGGAVSEAWNGDVSRPLGSIFKLMVLAAYAREVARGRLDPDEMVTVEEWRQWHIEGTDGGAFDVSLAALDANDGGSVTLDGLASVMIEQSDNVATDLLLDRIGREAVLDAGVELGLDALFSGVAPVAGWLLLLTDRELGTTPLERLERLAVMPQQEVADLSWRLAGDYGRPGRDAAATIDALNGLGMWEAHRLFSEIMPFRGSAADIAALLQAAAVDKTSPAYSEVAERHLAWPMKSEDVSSAFWRAGAKEGASAAVLNVAAYARPCTGTWAGEDRVVVLLTAGQDQAAWTELYGAGAVQRTASAIAYGPHNLERFMSMLGERR